MYPWYFLPDFGPSSGEDLLQKWYRDIYNYGQYINQFPPNTIKVIREFERIQKKICRHKMSIMFNEICINEEMLPKYTYFKSYIYSFFLGFCFLFLRASILFVDFIKAFDSIHRGQMEQILLAYGIPKEAVAAIMVLYRNTKCCILTSDPAKLSKEICTLVNNRCVRSKISGDQGTPWLSGGWIECELGRSQEVDGRQIII